MTDEIKFQRIDPFGSLTLTEAEMIGLAMSGQWFPMPVRYMTREEVEREFPTSDAANELKGEKHG